MLRLFEEEALDCKATRILPFLKRLHERLLLSVIYIDRGATACKLDPAGLAEASLAVSRAIAEGVALIINKFSKQEAGGRAINLTPIFRSSHPMI